MNSKMVVYKWISLIIFISLMLPGCSTSNSHVKITPKELEKNSSQKIGEFVTFDKGLLKESMIFSQDSQLIHEYRIGLDDVLDISAYGEPDLSKTQSVRPDGKISLPLIGDIMAYGKTPIQLRDEITKVLSKYVLKPRITVLITQYKSKKIMILGEVQSPGMLRLSTNIPLIEGISLAGGITNNADLRGSFLIRDRKILPIDFYGLLKEGDMRQNLILHSNDTIVIPSNIENKVYVLGDVKNPGILRITDKLTILEAITAAGGISQGKSKVLVIRGGLGNPQIIEVDIDKILKQYDLKENIYLSRGDIVFVPTSLMGNINAVLAQATRFLSPLILMESGIINYPATLSVIKHGRLPGGTTNSTFTGSNGETSTSTETSVPEKP